MGLTTNLNWFSPPNFWTINSIEATQYLKDGFNSFEQIPHDDPFPPFLQVKNLTKRPCWNHQQEY